MPIDPCSDKICKIINEGLFNKECYYSSSAAYGKRVLTNASYTTIENIQREDFVELIDYNPLTNTLLSLGAKIPSTAHIVHWIMHHIKKEIIVMIQIR